MAKLASTRTAGKMYDISVGNGFTTINDASMTTSGDHCPDGYHEHLRQRTFLGRDPLGNHVWCSVLIYAVHIIGPPQDRQACMILPPVAEIGATRVILPTMQNYQYQWTGDSYGWVPA